MSPTTLITGGAGFIGCALGHELVAKGDTVVAVDVLQPDVHPGSGRPKRLAPEVTLHPMDVRSGSAWDALLKVVSPDRIVHLAAETSTGRSLTNASVHASTNVVGTTEMLDALLRADAIPDHIVLSSSRAVYGEGEWESTEGPFYPDPRTHEDLESGKWDPTDRAGHAATPIPSRADRTTPHPTNVYAATKLAQENILGAWTAAKGADLSILRLQNVYGPGQSLTNSYTGVVTLFARTAAGGGTLDVYEDGNIVRDFVFVADVVQALVASLARPPRGRRTIDIGSGSATTILDVAQRLAERQGAPRPEITGRFRDGDVRAASTEIDLATTDLGYRPTWDLDMGLEALLDWIGEDSDPDLQVGGRPPDS
jgi:dTDP-L-rhamnose 4-epimerase